MCRTSLADEHSGGWGAAEPFCVPRPKPWCSVRQNVPLLSAVCGVLPFLLLLLKRRIQFLACVVTVAMCLVFPQVACSSGGPPTRPASLPCTRRPCRTSVAGESGAWLVGMWPCCLVSRTSVPFLGLVDTRGRGPLPLRGFIVPPPPPTTTPLPHQGIRCTRVQEGEGLFGARGLGRSYMTACSPAFTEKNTLLTVSVLQRLGGLCSSCRLKF